MLRIATWNINSVRLRIDQVSRFVAESGTDVLCLQEIKCLEDQFPRGAFEAMGLPYDTGRRSRFQRRTARPGRCAGGRS